MGLAITIVCIVVSIVIDGNINDFFNIPSIFIVVGGTIGATITAFPMKDLKKVIPLIKLTLKKDEVNIVKDIDAIIDMANIARKDGLLSLEESIENMDNPFLKNGVMLILDGTDPELVKNVMETEIYFMDERHSDAIKIFETMSSLAPAFGMIGTLIGLINMLVALSDPDSLGPAMSVALITTFYGVVLANAIFNPLANKLKLRSKNEQIQKDIIIEGILSIQDGENPRIIRDKLNAFVSKSSLSIPEEKTEQATEGGE